MTKFNFQNYTLSQTLCLENHYVFASEHTRTQTEAQTVPILFTSASDLIQRETPLEANVAITIYLKPHKTFAFPGGEYGLW